MSDMIKTHQKHIVVIGAGVIGLQTAIFLLQAGYKVTILAKHLPGDFSPEYTSPWAGAQWRTHATTDQPTQCKWDLETYNYWKEMVEKEAADRAKGKNVPQSGLGIYESLNLWADPTPLITAPDKHLWFLPHVISPSTLPATSLPPGVGYGVAYTTFCIDPTVYLRNLQNIFLSFPNARIIRHTLPTNNGLPHALKTVQEDQSLKLGKVFLFVNASGLGSKTLAQDDSMYPTRGQTILVKGEAQKATTWLRENGSISYAVPRPGSGSTILGGSKQDHDWTSTPTPSLSTQILQSCKLIVPELLNPHGSFEILDQQVGFRPSRQGGPRIEFEELEDSIKVVHCYGHAGGGYQSSVGSARYVVGLVKGFEGLKKENARL